MTEEQTEMIFETNSLWSHSIILLYIAIYLNDFFYAITYQIIIKIADIKAIVFLNKKKFIAIFGGLCRNKSAIFGYNEWFGENSQYLNVKFIKNITVEKKQT